MVISGIEYLYTYRVASTHDLNAILFPPSSENTGLHSCLGEFNPVASLYRRF